MYNTDMKITVKSEHYKESGQYIARILGTDPKYGMKRDFVGADEGGKTTSYIVDEPGLFEVVNIDKHGDKTTKYCVVIVRTAEYPPANSTGDPDWMRLWIKADEAQLLAKHLSRGLDIVQVLDIERKEEGYYGHILPAAKARLTVAQATDQVRRILLQLEPVERGDVLIALADLCGKEVR